MLGKVVTRKGQIKIKKKERWQWVRFLGEARGVGFRGWVRGSALIQGVQYSSEEPGYPLSSLCASSGLPEEATSSLLEATDPTKWLWLLALATQPPFLPLPLLDVANCWAHYSPCIFISCKAFATSSCIKFLIANHLVWTGFLVGPWLRHVFILEIRQRRIL